MMRTLTSFLFLVVLAGPTLNLEAALAEPDLLEAWTSDDHSEAAPGCAVASFEQGRLTHWVSHGYANLDTRQPLTADTLFYAASVSKQFTALAVIQLAVSGRLNLDDEVQQHIPELPFYQAPTTVRMLLQHTAGIRDSLSLLRLSGWPHPSDATMDEALELLYRQAGTNFHPGTATTYSNGGYLLLAEVVRRVSGEPFADYVGKHILKPLNMLDSFILDGTRPTGEQLAHGYQATEDGFLIRDTYPLFGGSGGLMITLADLARYEQDIVSGQQVWTPEVLAEMTRPGLLVDGSPARRDGTDLVFASGLMLGTQDGLRTVRHGGGAQGFRHQYVRIPARAQAIAVFCNRGDANPQRIVEKFLGPAQPTQLLDGEYRSAELAATYQVRNTADGLTLTITRAGVERQVHHFSRSAGDEGSFTAGGLMIRPQGDDVFTLETERARGIRLYRVESAAP
ncbi:MAG: serine hydrolase domain-containing protein [Wenzhouxiangella sp.]